MRQGQVRRFEGAAPKGRRQIAPDLRVLRRAFSAEFINNQMSSFYHEAAHLFKQPQSSGRYLGFNKRQSFFVQLLGIKCAARDFRFSDWLSIAETIDSQSLLASYRRAFNGFQFAAERELGAGSICVYNVEGARAVVRIEPIKAFLTEKGWVPPLHDSTSGTPCPPGWLSGDLSAVDLHPGAFQQPAIDLRHQFPVTFLHTGEPDFVSYDTLEEFQHIIRPSEDEKNFWLGFDVAMTDPFR